MIVCDICRGTSDLFPIRSIRRYYRSTDVCLILIGARVIMAARFGRLEANPQIKSTKDFGSPKQNGAADLLFEP